MTKRFLGKLSPRLLPALAAAPLLAGLLLAGPASAAEEGAELPHVTTDIADKASLQRGAQAFMNYCAGCHSLKYLRSSRLAEDLGLSEEQVQQNLVFTGAKFGDPFQVAMTTEDGNKFFGKMPPDLSLIARVRGTDWVAAYLKSFYLDESRPVGWNNTVFPNASMPNVLWQQQGLQHAEYGPADEAGERPVEKLVLASPGTQTPAQFDQTVRDITTFLEYAGEPAALKRQSLGVWAILFLAFFTFIAWLLKKEYWRDVH
ncbi:MAG TPA: cytochrome c1 [Xanthomonadaceae bacterium]|nr:cytochrome c1 [Xanthomonadaceae bacterium]